MAVTGASEVGIKRGSSEGFAVVAEGGSEVDSRDAANASEPAVADAPDVPSDGTNDGTSDPAADVAGHVPAETLAAAPERAEIFAQWVGVIVTAAPPRSWSTLVLQGAVFRSVPVPDRATAAARLKARLGGLA